MESSKSQVEFYLDLVVQLVRSDPPGLVRFKHIERDVLTLRQRTMHEGLSFLTKTLPKLGKALDAALVSRKLDVPHEFAKIRKNAGIPAFMQGYFSLLFDSDGVLLDSATPEVVRHLRQVLLFAYKLEVPYLHADEERVIASFVQTDKELEFVETAYTSHLLDDVSRHVADIFEDFDPRDISPRHGPGAVATGERLEEKWEFSRLYKPIHSVYPYYEYFIVGGARELIDRLGWYKSLERLDHGRAKVVLVPKDSRGPRLISCEPLEFQWIQQGLGRKIMQHLEKHRLTRGRVNFTLQEVNRSLALANSVSGEYATLDLKDASDRVSLALVRRAFSKVPGVLRALEACRTDETLLPSGESVTLRKYAPMGSALCFPVEATIFFSVIVSAISIRYRLRRSEVGKRVFVYGDDIIIPVEWASQSMLALEAVGLKVNTSKCCITGFFRESCGMDAFKGEQVTPSRLRKQWTGRQSDASAYAGYISLANALSQKGYYLASGRIWKELHRVYGRIPAGLENSPYPCAVVPTYEDVISENRNYFPIRWNRGRQVIEFNVRYLQTKKSNSTLDSWPRLSRDILMGAGDDPQTVVIPRSTLIKRGWKAA